MNGTTRAVATLAGAALAGVLLWTAAQFGRHSTGSYWAAYGIIAAAGLVFGLAQLRGRTGNPPAMFVLGFLPVLVAGGWVLVAMQPSGSHLRGQILSWSGHMEITGIVRHVGTWLGVIAFGIGYTLAAVLEPAPVRRTATPPYDPRAADEPMTAERREVTEREAQPVR